MVPRWSFKTSMIPTQPGLCAFQLARVYDSYQHDDYALADRIGFTRRLRPHIAAIVDAEFPGQVMPQTR